jgi:hypothetical protein
MLNILRMLLLLFAFISLPLMAQLQKGKTFVKKDRSILLAQFDLDDYLTEADGDDVEWSVEGVEGPAGFAVSLHAIAPSGQGDGYSLTVGFASNATDAYDFGIDIYAPPAPPPPAFDAALGWNSDRYYTQILADDGDYSVHEFDIVLSFPSDNLIILTWDNAGWSELGTFILQDALGGAYISIPKSYASVALEAKPTVRLYPSP